MGSTGESREHVSSIHRPPFSLRGARWRHCRYAINTATVRHNMQRKQNRKNTKNFNSNSLTYVKYSTAMLGGAFGQVGVERESLVGPLHVK